MKLLVGLGNSGDGYQFHRHNIGFLALDGIINAHSLRDMGNKHHAHIFKGSIHHTEVLAIKPETYMNRSGLAVQSVASYHHVALEDIWVLHDDLELPPWVLRYKKGGGHGGHNGLRNISEAIGQEYQRLRIGIGRPTNPSIAVADFVLSNIPKEEREILWALQDYCGQHIHTLWEDNPNIMIQKWNTEYSGNHKK